MGVLFVGDIGRHMSELWMERMALALDQHLAAFAAFGPTEALWHDRVPIMPLDPVPPPEPGTLVRLARGLGIPVRLPAGKTASELLKALVDRESVHAVLIHYLSRAVDFEWVWSVSRKPLFIHCHGFDITWDLRSHESPTQPVFPSDYVPAVLRLESWATFLVTSQSAAARLLGIGVSPQRIIIKPIGVPIPTEWQERRKSSDDLHILYLGRLVDCKGPDLVIRAFELACEQGLKAHLTLAGDGPLRAMCELLACRSRYRDRISLLGAVNAVRGAQLREQADIFTAHHCFGLLSHQEEAYGVSIVEAMGAGLPVVTGRSGGVTETVVDGTTGLLFEPGDIAQHAEALLRLADNAMERAKFGRAGWERAKAFYSWERERRQLLEIIGLRST